MGSQSGPNFVRLATAQSLVGAQRIGANALDHIAQVARERFKVPAAFVTLVDGDTLYFAGRAGGDIDSTPTEGSLCSQTVRCDDVFVLEDASADRRFAGNVLVAGPPFIRFYAGAPIIIASGEHVGSMCIIDSKPRPFNVGQRVVLKHMALAAKTELERICSVGQATLRPN